MSNVPDDKIVPFVSSADNNQETKFFKQLLLTKILFQLFFSATKRVVHTDRHSSTVIWKINEKDPCDNKNYNCDYSNCPMNFAIKE